MPLSAADLTQLGNMPITILSASVSNIYLRMDGTGVSAPTPHGGGMVMCESGAGDPLAQYRIRPQADGTYSFESSAFPGVFLRMDPGTVNCQYGIADAMEKYAAHAQADGSFSLESAAYPGMFLRMDSTGVSPAPGGAPNESFFLNMADQYVNFTMQHQQQTYWCWDATTVSIAAFYNPASAWTQGTLANTVFGRSDCAVAAGQVSPCNWGQWPDAPLTTVGHFTQKLSNALTLVQLGTQLAKPAPVVCNIAWAGGGGHIVALRGRSVVGGVDHVSVGDPWYGDSDQTYSTFLNKYQGSGTWNVSYPTQ